ncbi:MAG TPA: DDE-type integrase/transposase/recombinase [Candidatus Nitrosotenuis sp.]|nr:DDE-type integrase/transposase/recombinase [Candidatus Nitrosotenuis sp.]
MTNTNETNPREEKGKEIAQTPDTIRRLDQTHYQVRSQTKYQGWYDVIATESGWKCTCADHKYRHVCCKHIHAVEFSIKLREEIKSKNSVTISPISISECLYCKSENITKDGLRHNKYGNIQKFYCKTCNRYFTINIGFEKMKHDPRGITTAMQLYFSGESLRNVAKSLRLLGMEVSHQTVYNWIEKYTNLMQEYLDKITPQVGDIWRADEIFMKFSGNMKYLFAMMDDESRFLIAQEVADTKHTHDATSLFRKGKEVTQTKPTILITDGLKSYHDAYYKEFHTRAQPNTTHIRNITIKGEKNNNKMERINGEIRDREKVMRGLKKTDTPILTGYKLFHNYIRPHMGLEGQTPADKVGIKIEGDNKWITLIQNAMTDGKTH